MRDAPGAIFQDLRGPAMESLGTGREGGKAFFTFLLFYLFTFKGYSW